MGFKFTNADGSACVLGYLIYLAMACYLAAGVLLASKRKRSGQLVYSLGFLTMVAAFIVRWYEVEHAPLQNMFEVFLCLGMLIYPISVFCRRFLRVGGEAADAGILGFLLLFPAGFVFSADPQKLPPALQSPFFVPHVAAYMLSYIILTKAAVQAILRLLAGETPPETELVSYEQGAYRVTKLGFPLLTIGLVLGAWWAKMAWGDYWSWDPKELWSLVSWLVFLGYFHVRYMFGKKYPRLNAALVLLGLIAIGITLTWVNLSRLFPGLHSYAS
jgi:ABC-type transport system involved in cytochrome c biogenesis permease subunit